MPAEIRPIAFGSLLQVLHLHQRLVSDHLKDVNALLASPQIHALCVKKRQQELDPERLCFNLFHLISDTYHKENFQSDILAALLDPKGAHGAGHAFLHTFIAWLRTISRNGDLDGLEPQNFMNSKIEREIGRVDISVLDHDSKKAIIIENKINGALDQDRQLPRYLDYVEGRGFEPIAIVYLTLNTPEMPIEDAEWKQPDDHDRVHKILIPATAFNYEIPCLNDKFIPICEKLTTNIDVLFVLRQYGQLIHHLGKNTMNEALMSKLCEEIKKDDGETFANAKALVTMMNDLPAYRAKEVLRRFEGHHKPFDCSGIYDDVDAFFYFPDGKGVTIDVWCEPDQYKVCFWDRENPKGNRQRLDQIMAKSSMRADFVMQDLHGHDTYVRTYRFPTQVDALYLDLKTFLNELEKCSCIDRST
jgi:PD-(D/E)XK nuclease superfamily